MTDKEKAICKQYSKRDTNGKVHCSDCPLVIDKTACVCKKCNSAKQKEPYLFGVRWGNR